MRKDKKMTKKTDENMEERKPPVYNDDGRICHGLEAAGEQPCIISKQGVALDEETISGTVEATNDASEGGASDESDEITEHHKLIVKCEAGRKDEVKEGDTIIDAHQSCNEEMNMVDGIRKDKKMTKNTDENMEKRKPPVYNDDGRICHGLEAAGEQPCIISKQGVVLDEGTISGTVEATNDASEGGASDENDRITEHHKLIVKCEAGRKDEVKEGDTIIDAHQSCNEEVNMVDGMRKDQKMTKNTDENMEKRKPPVYNDDGRICHGLEAAGEQPCIISKQGVVLDEETISGTVEATNDASEGGASDENDRIT